MQIEPDAERAKDLAKLGVKTEKLRTVIIARLLKKPKINFSLEPPTQ